MNEQKTDKVNRNGYYERSFTTRVGTLELKVPRTRDGHTVFERYQRNEKEKPHGFNVGNVCIRRFNS